MRFHNQIVVLGGGAKGIGLATAEAFLKEGAKVVILDIENPEQKWLASFADQVHFFNCNIADAKSLNQVFSEIEKHHERVDILINNAGIQRYGSVTDTSEQEWDEVMGVNLKGAFLTAKQAIPLMQKNNQGVIINISSTQAFQTQRGVAAYTTSKTALLGLTRSIAVDYAPEIRCVAVCPGTIDTPMLQWAIQQSDQPERVLEECKQMHLAQRIGQPEEVANFILYLCTREASFITGHSFRIDGGQGILIGGAPLYN